MRVLECSFQLDPIGVFVCGWAVQAYKGILRCRFVQKVVDTSKSSKITPHHNLFNYCMGSTWCSKVVKTDFARSYSQTHPNDRFAYSPVKTRRKAAWMSSGHWPRLLRFWVVGVLLCHKNQCVLVWLPIYIYHHLSTSWKSRANIQFFWSLTAMICYRKSIKWYFFVGFVGHQML